MIRLKRSGVHVRRIEEVFRPGNPGHWVHPEWSDRFPWIVQGTTSRDRGEGGRVWDFALYSHPPAPGAHELWKGLGAGLGFPRVVHSHQVHGCEVLAHGGDLSAGGHNDLNDTFGSVGQSQPEAILKLGPGADGHVTASEGVLLGVTVADCVPVSLVDSTSRVIGLLHAGWRGAVGGILEKGIELLGDGFGCVPEDLYLHLGPAICGDCYEVGAEVHKAMGLPQPDGPSPVDLRSYLASRALAAGVGEARITESAWCTLCEGSPFFSHRRGERERQVGFIGILPASDQCE